MKKTSRLNFVTEILEIDGTLKRIYCVCAMLVLLFAYGLITYHVVKRHNTPPKVSMIVPAPYEPDEDDETDEWPAPQYVEALPLPTEKEITGIDLQLTQEWPKVPSDRIKKCRKK